DTREPARFANTAVPFLLDELERLGASKSRIVAQVVGGASMFKGLSLEHVGERNLDMVREQLARHRIRIVAEAVGGTRGRTLRYDPVAGIATFHEAGGVEQEITPLRYVFKEVSQYGAGVGGGRR